MQRSNYKWNMARVLPAALVLLLVLAMVPVVSAAQITGKCGDGVIWELDGGVLTVSGSGAMADHTETALAPWHKYAESIHTVSVEEGITHIGAYSFLGLEELRYVRLPDSLLTIGSFAFYGCLKMETADLGTGVEEIGRSAFERCRSLKTISLPGSLRILRSSAFYRCESLLSVTVPASVVTMEQKVFTYCSGLRNASVLANIKELPYWTFYGCYALRSVSLSSSIDSVGTSAFENCENLTEANYGGAGEAAESMQKQMETAAPNLEKFRPGQNLVSQKDQSFSSSSTDGETGNKVQQDFFESDDCVVDTQKTQTDTGTSVEIQVVLKDPDGWEDADQQIKNALQGAGKINDVTVDVFLTGDSTVKGEDLGRFADRDIDLSIRTPQGLVWHINGLEIKNDKLKESYQLSYTLKPLSELTAAQKAVIGTGRGYALVFHDTIDFKVKLELPLEQPRSTASFHEQDGKNGYKLLQKVVIDERCVAQFYLGYVEAETEYLVGINVPTPADTNSGNGAIVPDSMSNNYIPLDRVEEFDYVVTGVNSSWGINIGQLTLILAGVMIAAAVVVGVTVRFQTKRKWKAGVPNDGDDDF